jgi:PQQ-dependent catabolism-associated CXXCW motif protein
MRRRALWLALGFGALLASAGAAEPARRFPDTLAGATVLRTPAVKALVATPGLVILDVSEAPRRPAGLAAGTLWLPPPHRDIPGSIWIPGAGRDPISPELNSYFRARLAQLTGGSRDRPILVYCHPHCWMSWNAARRVVGYGYRDVFWYPDGIEGWEDAGLPTASAASEGPTATRTAKRAGGALSAGAARRD